MSKQKRFLSNRSSRFLRLSSLTTRVSSSYTGQKVKELFMDAQGKFDSRTLAHVRNAERIVRTLGELKGAAMKVGQIISIQADLLPPEFAEILSSLQQEAPPVDYEQIAAQITREFGKPPEALFARFDPEPHASASVGQVHRAALANGTEVVVKVQYPGVGENIEGDMKNLKTILSMGSMLGYRKKDLDGIFEEISERLYEELDYDQEMENLRTFRRLYKREKRVLIPRVFPPYCSDRVLTMEYLPGDSLEALLSPPYTREDRDHFGRLIFDVYAHQIFRLGLLHADPHPGNFAFLKDGRMIMYDFGCVQPIPREIQEAFQDLIKYSLEGVYEKIDEIMLRLGTRDPDKEALDADFYKKFVDAFEEIVIPGQPYEFGTIPVVERVRELAPLGMSKMLHFKPCRELIFIDRTIAGHYGNLRHLRAKGVWRDILDPYLEG